MLEQKNYKIEISAKEANEIIRSLGDYLNLIFNNYQKTTNKNYIVPDFFLEITTELNEEDYNINRFVANSILNKLSKNENIKEENIIIDFTSQEIDTIIFAFDTTISIVNNMDKVFSHYKKDYLDLIIEVKNYVTSSRNNIKD